MAFFSLVGFFGAIVWKIFVKDAPWGWASLAASIFFIGGVQLIMLSIVGSYIGRIYTEVQQRPLYVVKEFGNLNQNSVATPGRLQKVFLSDTR